MQLESRVGDLEFRVAGYMGSSLTGCNSCPYFVLKILIRVP